MLLCQISGFIFIVVSFFKTIHCQIYENYEFRIVGGRKTSSKEFPFHAELIRNNMHWCGGAIITKWYVVTAAHCVKDFEGFSNLLQSILHVRVGNDKSNQGGTVHNISYIYVQPNYVENAKVNTADIALLRVSKPFSFSKTVKAIKVTEAPPKEGLKGWVIGFGEREIVRRSEDNFNNLMAVELPVFNTKKCKQILHNLGKDVFCAGYSKGNKDSCVGDSGGPFSFHGTLYGIVAWGIGCGRPGVPGAYTNIFHYNSWIKNITKSGKPH